MSTTTVRTGYAPVNGLQMYYEIHGTGEPLVLLHGAFMSLEGYAPLLPLLAPGRQIIAMEQQGHGRTGDIDRPLTIEQMTEDTVALLDHLGIERADIFGYSMGAGIALALAVAHPDRVRKLVLAAGTYNRDGFHPGMLEGIQSLQPEHLMGTPIYESYQRLAPNVADFPALVSKIKAMDAALPEWSADEVRAIQAPTLLVIGDSDITRPEHMVEMFRLLGGGVSGDNQGMPNSQLAILPGTSHVSLIFRVEWLSSMVNEFLDKPMPEN